MATKKQGEEADTTSQDKGSKKEPEGKAADKGSSAGGKDAKKGAANPGPEAKTKKGNGKAGKAPGRDVAKEKKKDDESELTESIKDVRQFLREVSIEFSKITWPGRRQVVQETYSVLFLVTVITLMVLGFDWMLQHTVFGYLDEWARAHGGGIGRT